MLPNTPLSIIVNTGGDIGYKLATPCVFLPCVKGSWEPKTGNTKNIVGI